MVMETREQAKSKRAEAHAQIYYFWGKYLPGSPLVFGPFGGCDGLAVVGAARGKLFYTFVNVWYISTTDS